ncbi:MAG: formate--tetrahydrofolate ligase [Gammaproteobacteria bacterium]|nr:formate--tetrahydrofolate ligase [Gammaproteobacteria bacterium]
MADIDIARKATLRKITELAKERLGIDEDNIEPIGHYKAKLNMDFVHSLEDREDGKLVLVTAISPTPAGEGKTTTTIGLGDALNKIGKKAIMCLREPSLGPCFGRKGGAAGGGYAQVVPMEDINLHFTGDFHAISLAHNLLAALIDNHIHHGNTLGLDDRRITWHRVVDLNDRGLRKIMTGLGGLANGHPRETSFAIVTASEVMAILCLSNSLQDLKKRLGNIIIGYDRNKELVRASQINAQGPMVVLLKDAIKPNLVQTLENNPVLIHGGPFGNIAHGCNSVIATKVGLKLADYVVTEAGFGADLGAEKFINIKCRKAGLRPSLVVVVATIRALKYHGGADLKTLDTENLTTLEKGLPNLERHINNIRNHFGLPCIVAINHFTADTDAEVELLKQKLAHHGVKVVLASHWADGGAGAVELAEEVVEKIETIPPDLKFLYEDDELLWDKIKKVAINIYGASEVVANTKVRARIKNYQDNGYGHVPVCLAKTQYSFSTDPLLRGAPSGHVVPINDVYLAAGAEFLVLICGDIMTMPGLPKKPAADQIDIDEDGNVVGLF